MYLCSSYCRLCMFSVSDSSIYMIYCRSFNFPYVICYYLYLHTWTTSLDHVHVYLLCTPFGFIYVLAGLRLTTPDSHVQILEPGPWWPYCSWSECAANPFMVTGAQQKLGHRRNSSSQFLSCLVLEIPLAAREHLSAFVYLFALCTLVFSGDVIFL